MRPPPSQRAVISGATGSGKTTLLRDGFALRLARACVLDFVGFEWPSWPEAVTVDTCDALRRELRRLAHRPRWRLVVVTEPRTELFELLVLQLFTIRPGRPHYVAGVGGLTFICDEVDRLCGPREEREDIRGAWQRGRHVGMSILAAGQRLPLINVTVRAQSEIFGVCRQDEPRDVETIAGYVPSHVLQVMAGLPDYESVVWDRRNRTGVHLAGRDQGFRVLKRFSKEVARETAERQ